MVVNVNRYTYSKTEAVYSVFLPGSGAEQDTGMVTLDDADIISLDNASAPVLFNSPHSGRQYSDDFMGATRLKLQNLRKSEDAYIDRLIAFVPELGACLMIAQIPRSFVDLNRGPYELDSQLFAEDLPDYADTQTIRVQNGLGTIPRIISDSEPIYAGKISLAKGLQRINRFYQPYHGRLKGLLMDLQKAWGYGVLIDCHSMPSATVTGNLRKTPDIVLGNRFGKSCDPNLSARLRELFKEQGYKVAMNKPYAGGFITENYGKPERGLHAVQIEINRGLYLDEENMTCIDNFEPLKQDLKIIFSNIVEYSKEYFEYNRNAAE